MKIGIVADSHLGRDGASKEGIISVLEDISEYFKSEDVETVIHIGDMISESDPENIGTNVSKITRIFDNFDERYISLGNHDRIALRHFSDEDGNDGDTDLFSSHGWYSNEQVFYRTESSSYVLLDSSLDSVYDNVGYISYKSFKILQDQLDTNDTVHIFTHYPIDSVSLGNSLFDYIPERKYPVNKIDFFGLQQEFNTEINVYCGHVHPYQTKTEKGQMTDQDITAFEPVLQFDFIDNDVNPVVNRDIALDDLIIDIPE